MPLHIKTPLIQSHPLTLAANRSVWLKLEAVQPPGSFKIRGIGLACEKHAGAGKRRFISSSGGNAGIAVAYAGRCLSIPVVVVVPETTTENAKNLIRQENAEVIVHGPSWLEANALAQSMVGAHDAFIHPFDDPVLWTGHASMIDEVADVGFEPDAVVLSVGGGGLLSGVVEGLHRNSWAHVPVIAVETTGAATLAKSIDAGDRIILPEITSIATSLGAKQVCQRAFDLTMAHDIRACTVSDHASVTACERFLADHRILVEPACGASLSLAYGRAAELDGFRNVLIIACGGSTVTLAKLQEWSKISP